MGAIGRIEEAAEAVGEFRAGGTDVTDRLRMGVSSGPVSDLHRLEGLDGIEEGEDGGLAIGALTRLSALGRDERVARGFGALAKTVNSLATPQIRNAATLGGALLQRTRCAYYRHPHLPCVKKGDDACGGREGLHPNGVLFDRGGCAHPHPSSLGMALLLHDAQLRTAERTIGIAELYGDGAGGTRDHLLGDRELLTHVLLPRGEVGERTAYGRATARAEAEWPTVECAVRFSVEGGRIARARVAAGGVSQVPMRLPAIEEALDGVEGEALERAAKRAAEGANPLPGARWKLKVLEGTVLAVLRDALSREPSR